MKFKLDENFGSSIRQVFVERGHDCLTVRDENLAGASDAKVLSAATSESRILVTLDLDFTDVLRYPPRETFGIAVLSPRGRVSRITLARLAEGLLDALEAGTLRGKLWVVEPSRIREHEPEDLPE